VEAVAAIPAKIQRVICDVAFEQYLISLDEADDDDIATGSDTSVDVARWVVVRGCSGELWPLLQFRSSNCSTTSPLISQQTANDDDDIATGNSGISAVVLVETADRSS
jgi:hypothetical protein